MERPSAPTVAAYDAAIPTDPRAVRGQMFGHPCAFVNGNMFFGTFAQSVIARVGVARTAELVAGGSVTMFEPMPGRPWRDYVQVLAHGADARTLASLAAEAFENTAAMPPKEKKPKKAAAPKAAPKAKATRGA